MTTLTEVSDYSPREEVANVLTHGVSGLIALFAVVVAIYNMQLEEIYTALQRTGVIVYGGSLVLVFLTSSLYHAVNQPKIRTLFKRLDHCAIYLLIAGTYTPILTIAVTGSMSDIILSIVWAMAFIGIVFKIFFTGRFERVSVAAYLIMGWVGIVMVHKVFHDMGGAAFFWLMIGGGAYTVGVFFYVNKRIPFNHAIWHCFVSLGAFCHFWLITEHILASS